MSNIAKILRQLESDPGIDQVETVDASPDGRPYPVDVDAFRIITRASIVEDGAEGRLVITAPLSCHMIADMAPEEVCEIILRLVRNYVEGELESRHQAGPSETKGE